MKFQLQAIIVESLSTSSQLSRAYSFSTTHNTPSSCLQYHCFLNPEKLTNKADYRNVDHFQRSTQWTVDLPKVVPLPDSGGCRTAPKVALRLPSRRSRVALPRLAMVIVLQLARLVRLVPKGRRTRPARIKRIPSLLDWATTQRVTRLRRPDARRRKCPIVSICLPRHTFL